MIVKKLSEDLSFIQLILFLVLIVFYFLNRILHNHNFQLILVVILYLLGFVFGYLRYLYSRYILRYSIEEYYTRYIAFTWGTIIGLFVLVIYQLLMGDYGIYAYFFPGALYYPCYKN